MLDCGLSAQTALNFIPLPLVPSTRLSNLPSWLPRESVETQLEGVKMLIDHSRTQKKLRVAELQIV